ncbi:MAG: glycosyltransferase family 4 protein [Deltaproteobacteria bacterium]|nr:glycosyltransferase family 4 protein [Deltaproteobacteria bacterium]
MPRVALIGPELFPIPPIRGGATEGFIEHLARRLRRWQPVIISPADPDLPLQSRQARVEYRRVPFSGWRRWLCKRYPGIFPFYNRGVAALVRELQPDLLHVHNRPLLASDLKSRFPELPVLLHMHNLYEILGKRERPAPGAEIRVEGFVACSHFVLERETGRLAKGAAARFVVYNGVDVQAFRPVWEQPDRAAALRRRYGLTEEPVVLFVGKIRESKGVGLLLKAMHSVWRRLPAAVLMLVGGTEFGRGRTQRQRFQAQVKAAPGRVILTGFVPPSEVPDYYLLGDIFVAPSQIHEGLPLVVLEASAGGLPIVTTKMGGIPEFVQPELNGILLEHRDDPQELADKILSLLGDPSRRQRLARQGREWVLSNFSWEKIAEVQEHIYAQVAARRT